ncbi:MAG: hypothetical protein KME45_09595 [Stenomitos rutilans HA7619-LM2]|jgi:hypothetical protein|nr:hypothetical protein [Stenomitos rutilans HA7619-LM2]
MSSPFKTGVEEYARQCTVQRRRYEDCRQQTRQDETSSAVTQTWTVAQTIAVREAAQAHNLEHCTEHTLQSCMIDLLELPVDPLSWEGQDSVLGKTKTSEFEEQQCQDDHISNPSQTVTNPVGKTPCSVRYGAP